MKPTLLILAAGMASRYGSMKQVDGFGPHGETIIDYSIYDAIKAGRFDMVLLTWTGLQTPDFLYNVSFDHAILTTLELPGNGI